MSVRYVSATCSAWLAVLLLAACGGGSGDGSAGGGSGGGGSGGNSSTGTLSLSASSLVFTAAGLGATSPPSQLVTATVSTNVAAPVVYVRVAASGTAVTSVSNLQISGNSGSAFVAVASPNALGPGVHASTITVTACTGGPDCTSGIIGSPQTINVTYTINGLQLTGASQLDYVVVPSSPNNEFRRVILLKAYPSATLTSSVPWLTVTSASAITSNDSDSYDAALLRPLVDNMDSGRYTGAITVTVPGLAPTTIPVTLVIAKPQLEQVTPYVALANRPGTVTLRGQELNQISSSGIDLLPAGGGAPIPPTTVTVITGSELRMTYPPLAAGAYQVRMKDAQGVVSDRSRARLYVYDPPAFTATTLQYPAGALRQVQQLWFDPERSALWVLVDYPSAGIAATQILRYTYSGGAWSGPVVMRTGPASGMTLSADGQTLYLSSRAETMSGSYAVNDLLLTDPTTLQVRSTVHPTGTGTDFQTFAYSSNGDLFTVETSRVLSGLWQPYKLDSHTGEFAVSAASFPMSVAPSFSHGVVAGSADGSRILFADNGSFAGIYDFSASIPGSSLAPVSLRLTSALLDRTGDRALLSTYDGDLPLYDRTWHLLGSLPTRSFGGLGPAPATTYSALLAPSGTVAYTYTWGGALRRFDLTQSVAGEFAPDATPVALSADAGLNAGASNVVMAITPDGQTMFIAGGTQIVVVPLP